MRMEQQVLFSKLIPPMPSVNYMRRLGLTKKLAKSANAKVTILHSGAGYGKSSTLAQFFEDQQSKYSWYHITEDDDDLLPFLRHLLHSVRRVWQNFGENFKQWDSFSMFPKKDELNKLFTLFANDFCEITEPFYIVLDDFHVVNHVFQINYIMDKLIEFLPPNIHVVVATRVYPSWNCLKSIKMNGQLIECKETDFIFSEEEIQVLFEDYFNYKLSEQEVRNVLAVTEGWAMAILLMAIQNTDTKISFDELTKLSLKDFFEYLSDEIFEGIGKRAQQSLLYFSIFQTFSLELIEDVFGENEGKQLQELVLKHAFIQPLTGNCEYRFHSLIQQFLEEKWLANNPHQYKVLQEKASNYFNEKGNITQAVYHAFKTKDENYIGQILVQNAQYFIKLGQFDWLLDRIKELSSNCRNHYYQLFYVEGECRRFRAQYEMAKQAYEQCMQLAKMYEDHLLILRSNEGLANIYLDTIQPAVAEKYLVEVLTLAEHVPLKVDELDLLHRQYAENLVNLGFASDAEQWVSKKGISINILMQGNLDVRIFLRQGKLIEAKSLLENRFSQDLRMLEAHRETDVLLSLIYAMLGEGKLAKISASNGIEHSQREQAHYATAVANLRNGHAELLVNPFDINAAVKFYEKAIESMDQMRITRAKAESYMGLAIAKGRQGLIDEAVYCAQLGLYETERVQDRWVSGLLYIALTMIHFENNQIEQAKSAAERALELFQTTKDFYCEMVIHFWITRIAIKQQNEQSFCKHFNKFTEILLEQHYDFFITKSTIFGPRNQVSFYDLLTYAFQYEVNPSLRAVLVQKLDMNVEQNHPSFAIQIKLFGPMIVMRDWQELGTKAWHRDKAKELFCYLYLHHNRFVTKEELMHSLWPENDEEAMKRDFKVVYNALLKVLEPGRSAREESFYIARKQSMYKLIAEPFIISDIHYFEWFMTIGFGEKNPVFANEWLVKAVTLYNGTIFEDKPQLDWLQSERERYNQLYLQVLERLAQVNIRLKDFEQVIVWCERILKLDQTWEEAYRLLMFSYYQLQNRALAVKWYEKCITNLKNELNIEPMEITIQMYEMITR